MSSTPKNVSRRTLLSLAGGAAGLLAAKGASAVELPGGKSAGNGDPKVPSKLGPPVVDAPRVTEPPPMPVWPAEGNPAVAQPPKGPPMRTLSVPAASPEVLALFGGLNAGSKVGQWTIVAIHSVHLGAIPVILAAADGTKFQVDVFRRDTSAKAAKGVAETAKLAFFVSNKGSGSTRTDETQGLGAMALAAAIQKSGSAPANLLTLRERHLQFPGGGYALPV